MTKMIPLLLLACGAFFQPASAETITLNGPSSVALGSTFDVAVDLTGAFDSHDPMMDAFFGYGFNVAVDPVNLLFLGDTAGPLFDRLSGTFPDAQVYGLASASLPLLGPGDFSDPLTLAVLHFEAVGLGPATINISGDPSVSMNQGLFYLAGFDPISASFATTVPEPTSFLWSGIGLIALAFFRRSASGKS